MEVGFDRIRTYITRRHNTVAHYIVPQPILDLCVQYTWSLGARVSLRWWEQDGLYLEGAKKRAAAESDG